MSGALTKPAHQLLGQWGLRVIVSKQSEATRFAIKIKETESLARPTEAYSWIELGSKVQNRALNAEVGQALAPWVTFVVILVSWRPCPGAL